MDKFSFGVIFALLLVSLATPAFAGGLNCVDGNLTSTINIDGNILFIEKECENGCAAVGGGMYECVTTAFVVPMELYLLFEAISFILLLITIYNFTASEENTVIFPALGMILFAMLSIMSFSLPGYQLLAGAALNFSLTLVCLMYFILNAVSGPGDVTKSAEY